MKLSATDVLRRLGEGEPIDRVCAAAGLPRAQFDPWWQAEARSRVPDPAGVRHASVGRPVTIARDRRGVPHVLADGDEDLFFGFGYALAQDRLFQIDYLRRRGSGRLAEILGPDGAGLELLGRVAGFRSVLELDLLARTVGLRRIAEREWETLPADVRALVSAFSRGINAVIEETQDRPPVEFDLLGYRPEPWSEVDCLTVEGEFRWYLTGRFPVIAIPELARRTLGDGPLYRAFLQVEEDGESILPPGSYSPTRCGTQPVGVAVNGPPAAEGSNNWVIGGSRSATGRPLLASDPHIAFDAVSCWYEVHLCGGSFNVAGAAYAGMPGVLFGRNERVAWGCTNNICSQRDLYQERTDPAHPGCYLHDGRWDPARTLQETIHVRAGEPVTKTIVFSRNGPIVDEVLPPAARGTGPVSLRWLGASEGGWLTAVLAMNRARSAAEFRAALRPWHVPTFSVVYADVDGHVGYQAAGRVPVRDTWERGYRPGWDPAHQWRGLVPFEGMPHVADPPRGWVATANNRPAPEDFPYPLAGTWADGLRARRIREMIEARPALSRADCATMQHDALSLRAVRCLPGLTRILDAVPDARTRAALDHLRAWDGRVEPDSVAATLFEVFFAEWTRAVARERFEGETAAFVAGGAGGLAAALLAEGDRSWFAAGRYEGAVAGAMATALDWLAARLGPEMGGWNWGRLHVVSLRHVLSGRGHMGRLLDRPGVPVRGNAQTVCNTGLGADYDARTGAGYRLIVDLAATPPELHAVDGQSQSGHPGSPHYGDQLRGWAEGEYHRLPLDRDAALRAAVSTLRLVGATG
jgi:penicillin amidase